MKKIFTLIIGIVFSITILNSQVAPPQAFSFKAIIQGANGQTVVNKMISLRISILQDDINGFVTYSEYFTPTTNHYSQVDVEIGKGNVLSGIFSAIDWSAHKYFLKVEVDAKGGTTYQTLSTTQLLSVPYALYAGKAGFALSANEIDGSVTNEIQTLSIDGDVISLTNGGSVKLPPVSGITGQYYYADEDNDTYGDRFSPVWVPTGVAPPANFVTGLDCNDNNPAIHPGATEICGDGIDQDCNGSDLLCTVGLDNDGDGYTVSQGDCNDNNPNIHPGALEICDNKDNDCDWQIDEPPISNCATPQNMIFTGCNSGMCQFSCRPGWWDLNGDQSDGCESSTPPPPLATSATNISGNSFQANWSTVYGGESYFLDVSTNITFSTFVSGFDNLDVMNEDKYNVTGLIPGMTYYYRIRSSYNSLQSASSNKISVTTQPE